MNLKNLLFLLLFLFFGQLCRGMDNAGGSSDLKGLTTNNFPILDGSDSTYPLRQILMCKLLGLGYEWQISPFIQNPDEAPHLVQPLFTCTEKERIHLSTKCMLNSNTHESFVNLIDSKVEIIITARSISRDEKSYAEEQGVTLTEKPIARDALTFMVNPENTVKSLTIEQIQAIYTGDIVNWSEVGGQDMTIVPYVRNRNSGSQEKFETMVMDGLTIKDFPEMQIGRTMMTPYYQLEQDKAGIGFTPFYYYSVIVGTGTTKAIGVNGTAMTKENIINGTYPYITNVYAAVRSDTDKSSMAYRLFEFLTSEQGQAIVDESGYVPIQTSTGVAARERETITIVRDGRSIALSSPAKPIRVSVTDLSGRSIFSSHVDTHAVKLPTSLSGLYVISVWLDDGSVIGKKIVF